MSFIVQPQTLLAIGPSRSFGGGASNQPIFSGYVTITENATDAIEITQQPVQQGASIADHAFKKPVNFSIQILFQSQSVLSSNPLGAFSAKSPQSLSSIYQKLLALQSSFQTFTVTTPKRVYNNMLFSAIGQTTDKKTENCLAINASFQQIITVPILVGNLTRSQLKNAGSNGGTQKVGQKQSFLSGAAGALKSLFGGSTVGSQ